LGRQVAASPKGPRGKAQRAESEVLGEGQLSSHTGVQGR